MICLSCNITVFNMPALPIGIYRQGERLLDTLKSYYVKEAGMSLIYQTRLNIPSSCHSAQYRPLGRDNV